MARTLKRSSEAINNVNYSAADSPEPPHQRRRSASTSSSSTVGSTSPSPDADTQNADTHSQATTQTLIKKLVRLALSAEYARLPLRRSDISQKILKDNNASHRQFKPVFAGAQQILESTFGMTLVELPGRERTTLKDRRTQATQTQTQKAQSSANKAWILTSTLPREFKTEAEICAPSRGVGQTEAEYTGLYTFVVAQIYLNGGTLTDAKLERYLKRMNAEMWTVGGIGATDKLMQRMVKEGYVERRRDVSSGEEVVEWVVGPRGKVEVGVSGVADLVRGVYGFGKKRNVERSGNGNGSDDGDDGGEPPESVKIEEDELNRRLERTLGVKLAKDDAGLEQAPQPTDLGGDEEQEQEQMQETRRTTRGRPPRNNRDDEDQ